MNPNVAKAGGIQSQEEHRSKIKIEASSREAGASEGEEHQEKVKHYFQLFLGNTPQVRSEPVF